jgi:hypothetical protein
LTPVERCILEARPTRLGRFQVGLREFGAIEGGFLEAGAAQVGAGRGLLLFCGLFDIDDAARAQVGLGERRSLEVGAFQLGAAQVGPGQIGPAQIGTFEIGAEQVGVAQVGARHRCVAQVDVGEDRALQYDLRQLHAAQNDVAQNDVAQIGAFASGMALDELAMPTKDLDQGGRIHAPENSVSGPTRASPATTLTQGRATRKTGAIRRQPDSDLHPGDEPPERRRRAGSRASALRGRRGCCQP